MNKKSKKPKKGKTMIRKLLGITLLLSLCIHAEDYKPYKLDVVRNGKVYHQVASSFWASEYPSPIININAHKKGETTIKGYASLREKTKSKLCKVKNGLYHPWAKEQNSVIHFYTISPVESYEIVKNLSFETQKSFYIDDKKRGLKVGDKILNVVYGSEGYSQGVLHSNQKEEILIDFPSTIFEENPKIFKQIEKSPTLPKSEQWLHLKCADSESIFVQDEDLLLQKGIKEGQIKGYGDISI